MLKLEKSSRNTSVIITLREKESFLNSFLLKAFLIAFSIHIAIFLLFRIQPFLIKAEFLYPPIHVQMERPNFSSLTLVDEETADKLPVIPEPPLSAFMNEYAFNIESQLTSPWIDSEIWNLPFVSLENRLTGYTPPKLSIPLQYAPIQFFISGDLALRQLKKYDQRLDEKIPYEVNPSEPFYITYKVQIDPITGSVFWYERQRSTGSKEINALTEELLLSLEFAHSKMNENSTGTIDFVIHALVLAHLQPS